MQGEAQRALRARSCALPYLSITHTGAWSLASGSPRTSRSTK